MAKHDDEKQQSPTDIAAEHVETPREGEPKDSSEEEDHREEEVAAAVQETDPQTKSMLASAQAEKVFLQKKSPFYRTFVVSNGDQIAYDFTTKKGAKVSFSIIFVPDTLSSGTELDHDKELKKFTVSKDKTHDRGCGTYTAEGKGTVVLRFSNSSWVLIKELVLSTTMKHVDLAKVALDNARREVEERQQRRSAELNVEESKANADEEDCAFH